MASVVVNGDTSGAVTLTAPAVAGTVTVTLPSTSGVMAVGGGTITTLTTTSDITVQGVTVGRGAGAVATNTAVGASALAANSGGNNTSVGAYSLLANTTGAQNSAFGTGALEKNTTGANGTAVGVQALNSNTTASNGTAVGYKALYANTTGNAVNSFGANSLEANTTGSFNAAFGNAALQSNSTGSYNTAIGVLSLLSNTTSSYNTAVGYQAGYSQTSGIGGSGENAFFGVRAGYATTGIKNTFVGNSINGGSGAGSAVTSGNNNTILGGYTGSAAPISASGSNYIVLSDGDGWVGLHIKNGVGTSLPSVASGAGTNALRYSTATSVVSYDTSSARYKDNIRDSVYGLSHVMQMRSAQFEYKDTGRSDVGLIAEELDPIIPELVGKNKDGEPDSVSYDRMVSVLVKAIQELKAEVDSLKAQINQGA